MKDKWYKLDNSAKIMPSMTNDLNPNIFRLSVTLRDKVDKDILQTALMETLEEFPMFSCTMKTGLFWHYLEPSHSKMTVEEESTIPCAKFLDDKLFRVTYYKKRINLEVYHVLADGHGALEFLRTLVALYLNKKYNIKTKEVINNASEYEKTSDSFAKFDRSTMKIKKNDLKKAYKLKFPKKEGISHDVIEVHMSASKVKELAKKHNATVTIYLVATLISSIIRCAKVKDLKRPIAITIPVDLRNIFPSKTTRNFFYTQSIQYHYKETDTFDDIIEYLKEKFAKTFTKENLQDVLNSYMVLEKFLLIRIIPTVIKDFMLGLYTGFLPTETMTLSNLGMIKMPETYNEYIESFHAFMPSSKIHLTVASFKDDITLGFTSHFAVNEIERNMVKIFQEDGVEKIKVISNERGN